MTLVTTGFLAGLAVLFVRHVRATHKRQQDHEAVLRALKNLDRDIDKARNRILVMRGAATKPPTTAA